MLHKKTKIKPFEIIQIKFELILLLNLQQRTDFNILKPMRRPHLKKVSDRNPKIVNLNYLLKVGSLYRQESASFKPPARLGHESIENFPTER